MINKIFAPNFTFIGSMMLSLAGVEYPPAVLERSQIRNEAEIQNNNYDLLVVRIGRVILVKSSVLMLPWLI